MTYRTVAAARMSRARPALPPRSLLLAALLLAWVATPAGAQPPPQTGPAAPASGPLLTLERAYSLALRTNPSVRILRERVEQAQATLRRAWAGVLPTASFQSTFTRHDQEVRFAIPFADSGEVVIQQLHQFGFNILARQPLFVGPAYQRIGVARKSVELSALREVRSSQDFLLQVARGYYMVVAQKEVLKAVENKLEVDQKHLAAARAQFEVGQAPRSVVLRAELVSTQDEQNVRVERNSLDVARRQLAILVGVDGLPEVEQPPELEPQQASMQAMMSEARRLRADLRATDVSIRLAEQTKDAVWWSFAPTLDLSWLYRWTEAPGFIDRRGTWNLTFNLTFPIYDAGVRYADLRDARSRIREARGQQELLEQQVEADIVKLRGDVDSALAGVESARKAVGLARTTLSDMEASFEAGAVTQLDVLDASQRALEAEIQLARALYARDLTQLSLAHALGSFQPVSGRNGP